MSNKKKKLAQKATIKKSEFGPKTENQSKYFDAIRNNSVIFCTGPAGSGKSFGAFFCAYQMFLSGLIDKIVFIRPLVEHKNFGERSNLGAFPGSLLDKLSTWLGGVFDNAELFISKDDLEKMLEFGHIQFESLALCRGRTFHNSVVICEEAQNINVRDGGMKMLLTRLGENSKIIINGDLTQKDLEANQESALGDAIKRFKNTEGIAVVELEKQDIVRHPLVKVILDKYEDGPK